MNLYTQMLSMPWAVLPETLAGMIETARRFDAGESVTSAVAARTERAAPGSIAVLPVWGVIEQRESFMSMLFGGTSTERTSARLRELVADPGVAAIVLDVDSPGGSVSGVDELSAEIYRMRGSKPIVAVADSLMASAAYWIASAADEVVVTPSGEVGSIGVLTVHTDLSGMLEAEGVNVTILSAGEFKTEGNPYEPLGDEARAAIQARVDEYYGMFVTAVARNRGVGVAAVREGYGRGRVVGAKEAVATGLANRIATLDTVLAGMAQQLRRERAARAEVDDRRRRQRAQAR